MNPLYSKPKITPPKGRNGFDLSFRRSYTAPCGMLLPVAKDFGYSGEKYILNSQTFVRTEPVQTAAFTRLKGHVEWFFVPVQQLYSLWNEFYNQTDDVMSSIFTISGGNLANKYGKLPLFKVFPTMSSIVGGYWSSDAGQFEGSTSPNDRKYSLTLDPFGVPKAWNFRRLWDMFDYGSLSTAFNIVFGNEDKTFAVPLLDFLAYHKIFHSHYMITNWFKNNPKLYNVDQFFSNSGPIGGNADLYDILSTIHYRPYRKDFWTSVLPQPVYSDQFANFIGGYLDQLQNSQVNPEALGSTSTPLSGLTIGQQKGYGSYGLLMTSERSTNVGSNHSAVEMGSPLPSGYTPSSQPAKFSLYNDSGLVSVPGPMSAADIRSVFAIDKLLRVTAFAGSHYEDQVKAHFGFDVPEGIRKEAYMLGSQTFDINIAEVIATASTGAEGAGSTLGDLAGKGYSANGGQGKDIYFKCPCDGILMAIFSIEPIVDYATRQCIPQNRYSQPFDFFHPELDNLGMQPLFGQNLYTSYQPNSQQLSGWQYRWMELKTNFDKINESFWDTDRYSWVTSKQNLFDTLDVSSLETFSLEQMFYIMPQYTNSIFLKDFPYFSENNPAQFVFTSGSNSWKSPKRYTDYPEIVANDSQEVYSGDNFLVSTAFKIYKTSLMSETSLPRFN